jgi:hypothetical protein
VISLYIIPTPDHILTEYRQVNVPSAQAPVAAPDTALRPDAGRPMATGRVAPRTWVLVWRMRIAAIVMFVLRGFV